MNLFEIKEIKISKNLRFKNLDSKQSNGSKEREYHRAETDRETATP